MDASNPFAQPPLTPEPIIAQVCRQVRAEAGPDWATAETLVDRVVRELWDSRVKTFVPILALRETRDLLREAQHNAQPVAPEPLLAAASPAVRPFGPTTRSGHDRIEIGRDARAVDWQDALRTDDDVLPL